MIEARGLAKRFGPVEAVPFRSRLASPPAEGHDVQVRFFTRRDAVASVGDGRAVALDAPATAEAIVDAIARRVTPEPSNLP